MKIYNQFLNALPFAFQNTSYGANKNFHKLLGCIFEIMEFQMNELENIRLKTFDLTSKESYLDYIASLFGLSRNLQSDEDLLFEIYIGLFLKHNDGTNNWILSFVKKVFKPIQSFFIFEDLEMIFYFQFKEHPTEKEIRLLKLLKDEGIVMKVFYTIGKEIIPIPSKDVLPLYANNEKLYFNDREAVVHLKFHMMQTSKPPLETAEFFVIEDMESFDISKNFIRLI